MSRLDVSMPGQYLSSSGPILRNETGATMVKGDVALVDASQTEAENSTVALAQEGLTPVTTAAMKQNRAAVCLDASVPDHGYGHFAISDGQLIQIKVNNSAILKGSLLKAANAATTLALATNGTDRPIARALEANSSTAALIWCEFYPNGIPAIA